MNHRYIYRYMAVLQYYYIVPCIYYIRLAVWHWDINEFYEILSSLVFIDLW